MMTKHIMQILWHFFKLYWLLLIIFTLSLVLACLVPKEIVQKNIAKSIEQLLQQGDRPRILGNHKLNQLDNYTESVMLGIIYNHEPQQPLASALRAEYYQGSDSSEQDFRVVSLNDQIQYGLTSNTQYPRYWHGYIVFIRPLLALMPYQSVQKVLQIAFFMIFSILVAQLSKKISIIAALSFSVSLILVNISIIPLTIHASMVFFICMISMLYFIFHTNVALEKAAAAFFIIGALTSYMDLLTAPLVTFAFPAIVMMLMLNKQDNHLGIKYLLIRLVVVGMAWILGYALLWVSKWILTSIVFQEDFIAEGINAINERIGRQIPFGEVSQISSLDAIQRNLNTLYTYTITNYPIMPVAIPVFLIGALMIFLWHRKDINISIIVLMSFFGLLPYIWYAIAANHSYIHSYFTSRVQAITLFSVSYIFLYTLDWEKVKSIFKFPKKKNVQA